LGYFDMCMLWECHSLVDSEHAKSQISGYNPFNKWQIEESLLTKREHDRAIK